jgi:hypothetical protein
MRASPGSVLLKGAEVLIGTAVPLNEVSLVDSTAIRICVDRDITDAVLYAYLCA